MSKRFDCCMRLVSKTLTLEELERLSGLENEAEPRWSVGDWIAVWNKHAESTLLVVGSDAPETDLPIEHLKSVLELLPDASRMAELAQRGVCLEIDFAVYSDTYTTSIRTPINELIAALRDCPMEIELGCSFYPSEPPFVNRADS